MSRLRLLLGTALIVVALTLAACGGQSNPRLGMSSTASSTATRSGSPSPGTPLVALAPLKARYAAGELITITVRNSRASPVYVIDNHTDCTPVQLERTASGGWQGVGACLDGQPHPHVLQIGAGESLSIQLVPEQVANLDRTWPPGTYRAALTFAISASQAIGQGPTVYSQPFTVG